MLKEFSLGKKSSRIEPKVYNGMAMGKELIVLQGPIGIRGHKLYFFMNIKDSIIVLSVIEII